MRRTKKGRSWGKLWDAARPLEREMALHLAPLLSERHAVNGLHRNVKVHWTPRHVLEAAMFRGLRVFEDSLKNPENVALTDDEKNLIQQGRIILAIKAMRERVPGLRLDKARDLCVAFKTDILS